jgi:phenylpropionate dioxygenase-like ring-hydroxylating dioxygenase large terminal subunit
LKSGYAGVASEGADPLHGLAEINSFNYRGFVFARLATEGVGFQEFFGDSLSSIDNMVDRSPEGRLEVAGGVLRYLHDCNWMYVENLRPSALHARWPWTRPSLKVGHSGTCGRCLCNRNERDTPLYVPFQSNDYNWCSGSARTNIPYHCSTARIVSVAKWAAGLGSRPGSRRIRQRLD